MSGAQDLQFGPFRLVAGDERLWRGAEAIVLRPKSFAVLRYLVARAERLVTKEELVEALWPGLVVSEAALTVCVGEIRKALGDDPHAPQFIATVHRRGYRFIGPVVGLASDGRSLAAAAARSPEAGTDEDRSLVSLRPRALYPRPVGMVGRETALPRLHGWLAQARRGVRQVGLVTGEAGIGKTTVVDAFLAHAATDPTLWVARGQCVAQHGAGEAYLPVLDALRELGRGPGGEEVLALLEQHAPTWLVQLPALLDGAALVAVQRRVQGATRARMLRELADVLEALTAAHPLVLVLEELHWSDAATLDLVAYLAQRREPAQLLLLGTYRPVETIVRRHPLRAVVQELVLHRQGEELALELLTESQVAQYLAARFAGSALPADLARSLYRHTEGHPLFMTAVADEWVRRAWLQEGAGPWAGPTPVTAETVGIPESLRVMIERQLEQLSAAEQRVLAAASVVGMAGSAAAVAAGVEIGVEEVEERCAGLARRGQFLQTSGSEAWPDGTVAGCYTFRHALYQQVVYARLPAARRRGLHQRIGMRTEAGYGARAAERAAELAEHFERGGDAERAVVYRRRAAENALGRWAYQEAIAHLNRGLETLQRLPDTPERMQQELDMQTTLGRALMVTRGYSSPETMQAYTRAHVLCRQMGDARQLFRVLRGLQLFHLARVELQTAHEIAAQLLTIAESLPDHTLLPDAHRALGEDLFFLGVLAQARTHLEQGIALYAPQQHGNPALRDDQIHGLACYPFGALTLWLLGYPDQALHRAQQALILVDELSPPMALAAVLSGAAALHQFRGEAQGAQQPAEALVALAREHGMRLGLARGTILWGWALAAQGQRAEGLARIHEGLAAFRAIGAEPLLPYYLALLAEAYGKGAQVEDGLTVLAEALAMVPKAGGHFYEAELYRLKGELLFAQACQRQTAKPNRHMTEAGEACFQQALAVARYQQAKALELRAAMSLSRLWQRQGKRADARQLLAPIYGWFTEGFDTADLREAQALLAELS